MMAPARLAAYALTDELSAEIQRTVGTEKRRSPKPSARSRRLTIECISNSDALYHE